MPKVSPRWISTNHGKKCTFEYKEIEAMEKKLRVGVTGAAGHLGGVLVRKLLDQGHEVVALVQNDQRALEGLEHSIQKMFGNVTDATVMDALVREVDVVVHAAAKIAIGVPMDITIQQVNVEGTKHLVNACILHRRRLIHISSVHAFQQAPALEVLDEQRPMVGSIGIPYDVTKAESQRLVLEACAQKGLHALVLCPSSLIGPPDFKPSLIGQALQDMLRGKIPALFEGGFDFTDVRDVADACIEAIHSPLSGEVFILSGKWYSMKTLSVMLGNAAGKQIRIPELPVGLARILARGMEWGARISGKTPLFTREAVDILVTGNRLTSAEKAKKALNYSPRPLENSLTDYVQWLKHPEIKDWHKR